MTISLLSDEVIRKIAAGEVIERPANVVKELIENSIDSSATDIQVEIVAGGRDSITVKDNGCGIKVQDVPNSVLPHATSKLSHFEDLNDLMSFGFRGEALASISAVSKFRLKSRSSAEAEGVELQILTEAHLKDKPRLIPYSGPVGTEIRIEELFYNVPARRHFLRRAATEYGYILEVVQAISLAYPHIHWKLVHNGKTTFESMRVEGEDFTEQELFSLWRVKAQQMFQLPRKDVFCEVSAQNPYVKLAALITPPGVDFANSKRMFTFANKRWLKDKALNALILRGYQTHLLRGRYPGCILMLSCEPSLCDINIHPAKKEIKFQYQKEVGSLIVASLQKALRSAHWVDDEPNFASSSPPSTIASPITSSVSSLQRPSSLQSFSSQPSEKGGTFSFSSTPSFLPPASSSSPPAVSTAGGASAVMDPILAAGRMNFQQDGKIPWQQLRYIGTFGALYLIFEDSRGQRLMFVDQHGFHERILFEKLTQDPAFLYKQGRQKLLVEHKISLSPSTLGKIQDNAEQLLSLGFVFSVDEGGVSIKEVPVLLAKRSLEDVFEALAAIPLGTSAQDTAAWLLEDILATIACHSAIRGGEVLSDQDLKWLLACAESVDFYHNCPHGRRVFYFVSKKEIARWFDRL
ncbi:MAG: DNA mismatch repair endonuclease MutL [Proteobacteria bacterium]|nr:DNA mismatch repair endonuclease MutL [Pseudomonadota bacterium]